MYQAKLFMLAVLCATLFVMMVASSGGTVNLVVGVTEVSYVEQHYGQPAYTYVEFWGGYPCVVFVYPHWNWTQYVYVRDGFVVHVEERW